MPDPRPIASHDSQLRLALAQAERLGVDRELHALVGGSGRAAGERTAWIVPLEHRRFPFLGDEDGAHLAQARALVIDLEHYSFKLVPGMPAEAFIATGERTALSYLVRPLADQFTKAFRER